MCSCAAASTRSRPRFLSPLAKEAAGIVTAIGEGVDVALGSRVMVVTGFIGGPRLVRRALVGQRQLHVLRYPTVSTTARRPASGSPISPDGSAWSNAGHLASGEWMAVLGAAGGSGIAAVQLGRALGARVIAVVSDEERAAFCRDLGAEVTLNRQDGPLAPALREITGGRGVDVVYDPVGERWRWMPPGPWP